MRISEQERKILVKAARDLDPEARVWLFGSRTDDSKRGGDIDVAVLSDKIGRSEKIRMRRAILDEIGEQHLDIILSKDGTDPFFVLATEKGVPLDE